MHSHLIPGIDDGAKTIEESIHLIKELKQLGFEKIITTPHIHSDYYKNTPEIIRTGFESLKQELLKQKIDIEISIAAEYFIDEHLESLIQNDEELLTFSGKHILVEYSTFSPPMNGLDIIFQLVSKGYQPILAHPERYLYYESQLDEFERIRNTGCELQVNLLSLTDYYGKEQRKLGIQLIEKGWVNFLGTDLHRKSQLKYLSETTNSKLLNIFDERLFKNVQL